MMQPWESGRDDPGAGRGQPLEGEVLPPGQEWKEPRSWQQWLWYGLRWALFFPVAFLGAALGSGLFQAARPVYEDALFWRNVPLIGPAWSTVEQIMYSVLFLGLFVFLGQRVAPDGKQAVSILLAGFMALYWIVLTVIMVVIWGTMLMGETDTVRFYARNDLPFPFDAIWLVAMLVLSIVVVVEAARGRLIG